ncbi:uncharacterized protein [Chanodichthys erythropterus]|uniref:uncharacterized protein isoform X2 n=1 Tax=Chanodichthys erythropterus TaxID=933992 RepID=UPI00351EBB96
MRATVIDHVIVHGMTMTEAGLRVRPNLSRFTVATIIRAFRQHNRVERMPHRGGRVAIFTAAQETLNLIRLREIRDKVIADNVNFESIDDVSLATIDRVLRRQKMRMKQVYRVPFECNSARHKDLRYEGYYSWTRWPDLMSTSSWMRLASTCRNEGKEASLRFLANGGVILLFVRPWVWRGLSTGMLSLGLTTPNVSSPS